MPRLKLSLLSFPHHTWVFTINNPTADDQPHQWPDVKEMVFQMEHTTVKHLQGCVKFNKPIFFEEFKRMTPRAHLEPCMCWHASVIYCTKQETSPLYSAYCLGADMWRQCEANNCAKRPLLLDPSLSYSYSILNVKREKWINNLKQYIYNLFTLPC